MWRLSDLTLDVGRKLFIRKYCVMELPARPRNWKDSSVLGDVWTTFKTEYGPRRDEVTGGWRRLHNEELNGL